MSDDALRHAKAWTHPEATRSTHAFFEAIAERIPAGQTTTPLVTLDELATGSHQVERTARTNRDFLVGIGQVKVHDGGRGIKDARYEMLQLTSGERPIVPAPLPLLGRPKPPTPKKAKGQWRTSDLFADLEGQRSDQRSDLFADVAQRSDLFADVGAKVGSFCRPLWKKVGSFCRRLLPLAGTRAHATYNNLKISTTTTAALPAERPRPQAVESPPCRWRGKSHAWCDGRVHVPKDFHLEERRKLGRRPGETDADLDQRLFTRYAETLAAIPDTEDLPDETEFNFWKRVLRSTKARAPTREAPLWTVEERKRRIRL